MKARLKNVTIEFDNVPGIYDYPKGLPLPRIGDMVFYDSSDVVKAGTVYAVWHQVTFYNGATIKIKVRES